MSERQPLVYAITCQLCNMIYAGETARFLVVRFAEHLADIRHNHSKSVAQHFNSAGHTITDVRVKGLWQVHGDSFQRKHMESHIIQRLGIMTSTQGHLPALPRQRHPPS